MSICEFNFSTIFAASLFYNLISHSTNSQHELSVLFPFLSHYSITKFSFCFFITKYNFSSSNSKSSRYAFITVNSYCPTPTLNIPETCKTESLLLKIIVLISLSSVMWVWVSCFGLVVLVWGWAFFPLARTKYIFPWMENNLQIKDQYNHIYSSHRSRFTVHLNTIYICLSKINLNM